MVTLQFFKSKNIFQAAPIHRGATMSYKDDQGAPAWAKAHCSEAASKVVRGKTNHKATRVLIKGSEMTPQQIARVGTPGASYCLLLPCSTQRMASVAHETLGAF